MAKLSLYEAVRLGLSERAIMALSEAEELDIESGAERVVESPTWLVIIPHTFEAMVKYGRGTHWDPAHPTQGQRYFDMYTRDGGKFMIFINKATQKKYLGHTKENIITDENDSRVTPEALQGIPYELLRELDSDEE